MKCEACGGDGQIEYGAYRGDESGPTRECRLCGGVMTTTPTVIDIADSLSASAQSASGGLTQLAHKVSESGKRLTDLVVTTSAITPKERYHRLETNHQNALWTAKQVADQRLEQLRLENEREQARVESLEARRAKIESELRLLELQRGTYIAKGTENIVNKYEEDLRRELRRYAEDEMNQFLRDRVL